MKASGTGRDAEMRRRQLHAIARAYVTEGLEKGNFDAIPYHENVSLRAPLCPGGSSTPLVGKENLRAIWWSPIPLLVGGVKVVHTYVNETVDAVAVEFHLTITEPACMLRILDRFIINEQGEIVDQENFFDPRDLTNPNWRSR